MWRPKNWPPFPPHGAHLPDDLAIFAFKELDVVVGEVGDVQKALLPVGREHHATGGPANAGGGRDHEFPEILSFPGEDLDAIRIPVGRIHKSVTRDVESEVAGPQSKPLGDMAEAEFRAPGARIPLPSVNQGAGSSTVRSKRKAGETMVTVN
jgi:hypothetical protein